MDNSENGADNNEHASSSNDSNNNNNISSTVGSSASNIDQEFNALFMRFFDEPIMQQSTLLTTTTINAIPTSPSSLYPQSVAQNIGFAANISNSTMKTPEDTDILLLMQQKEKKSERENNSIIVSNHPGTASTTILQDDTFSSPNITSSSLLSSSSMGARSKQVEDQEKIGKEEDENMLLFTTSSRVRSRSNESNLIIPSVVQSYGTPNGSSTSSPHSKGGRKKKSDEEKERLIRENMELRNDIIRLRSQLQSLPEDGDADRIENELLKNCLNEHKKFIQNCLTLSVPSERVALRSIGKQGADFAFNHILNIVASSQNGKDWKPLNLSSYKFSLLKPGTDITMCYRIRIDEKGRKMTDIRADLVSPQIDAADSMDVVWRIGSDKTALLNLFGSANPCEFLCTFEENYESENTTSELDDKEPIEAMEFHIYREQYPAPSPPFDSALISAKTTRDLAVSTLWSRPEFTPLSAIIRDQYTPIIHSQKVHARRSARRAPTATTNRSLRVGDVRCHMLVRTSTQYTSADPSQGVVGPVPHWIRSHVMAGAIGWNDEAQIEITTPVIDENGVENLQLRRETVPAARTVAVISIFDDAWRIQNFRASSGFVSSNGDVAPQFAFMMELCCKMVAAQLLGNELDETDLASTSASSSKRQKKR